MKKIITVLFCSILILIFTISFKLYEHKYFYETFQSNSYEITVSDIREGNTQTDFLNKVRELSQKHNVNIAKYVFRNKSLVDIFTVDIFFDNKIKVSKDAKNSEQLSNDPKLYKNKSYGEFYYPSKSIDIQIFSIDEVVKYGVTGKYALLTDNESIANDIMKELNSTVAFVDMYHSYIGESIGLIQAEFLIVYLLPFVILLSICIISATLIMIKLIINKSKDVGILRLNGYSNNRITLYFINEVKYPLIVGFIASNIIVIILTLIFGGVAFILPFILRNIVCFLILFMLFIFLISLIVIFISYKYNLRKLINKVGFFKWFNTAQIIFKYLVVIFVLISMSNTLDMNKKLQFFYASNSEWEQAEDVYKIVTKFTVPNSNLELKRPLEIKAKQIYEQFEENNDTFLLYTGEYSTSYNNMYMWERNNLTPQIIVNRNYLERHPIKTLNGDDVLEHLIIDDNVSNILVPEEFKDNEMQIRAEFLDDFIFRRIKVQKSYSEDLGEPLLNINENDLKINTIYIENDNKYFTYNQNTAIYDDNVIKNPVVVVDTLNLDDSFYYSFLTNSVFFESKSIEPLNDLQPLINKYDMASSYNSLNPIYDSRALEIKEIMDKIQMNLFTIFILFCILGVIIYLINASYFDQNKRVIFIKYSLGFSIINILKYKVGLELILYIILLMLFDVPTVYKLFFILFDIIINVIFIKLTYKKSINNVIKGGL